MTLEQAKQGLKIERKNVRLACQTIARKQLEIERLQGLLAECERVLILVPARSVPGLAGGRYLEVLQSDHIAPLMKKLRGQT